MKTIGILGGSFDPVHLGHTYIAKQAKKELSLDEVWFVPSYQAPLKDEHIASFKDRVAMLKRALKPYRYMKISTIEATMSQPSYSFHTMQYFIRKYPFYRFYWIIGDDQLQQLDQWYQIEELKKMVEFVVVNRHHQKIKTTFKTIQAPLHPATSTDIRQGNFDYLYPTVKSYINQYALYYPEFIKTVMSEYRYQHVLSVATLAADLAKHYRINPYQALLAAYLHDYTKEFPKEEMKAYMEIYFPQYLHTTDKIWHSYVGVIIAKQRFSVYDQDVLDAIMHHSDGESKKLLSLIIYCADKAESRRPFETASLQALCFQDIKKAKTHIETLAQQARKE